MNNPPLKWAGSKRQHLERILGHIGKPWRFFEPMCGTAVVARNVPAERFYINDLNKDLINLYEVLETHPERLIEDAKAMFEECNTKEWYLFYRKRLNDLNGLSDPLDGMAKRAAIFVYLNKHGFRGLCRYNRSGGFNVPYGYYPEGDVYFPEKELIDYASWLKRTHIMITSVDYATILEFTKQGDVVYLDPPFVGTSKTANFTDYSGNKFGMEEQVRLVSVATKIAQRGVKVIVSNRDCEATRRLYADATIESFPANNTIGVGGREKVMELLAIYGG